MVRETNPPLFYSALHLWLMLVDPTIVSLRLLPILGGAIELALLAAISRRCFGWTAAIACVSIAGISAQTLYYSEFLRSYIFVTDAVLVSLLGLLIVLGGRKRRLSGLALYAAGAVAAGYLHTTLLLWPFIATAAAVCACRNALAANGFRLLRDLAAADGAILLCLSWWVVISLRQIGANSENIDWIAPRSLVEFSMMVAESAFAVSVTSVADFACLAVVLAVFSVSVIKGRHAPAVRLLFAILALGLGTFKLADLVHPITTPATLFWLSVFPLILIPSLLAAGNSGRWRWLAIAAVVVALAANLFHTGNSFEWEKWDKAFDTMVETPGSTLLVEQEAMGVVAGKACRFHFRSLHCPIPVLTLVSTATGNRWAHGLGPIDYVDAAAIGRLPPSTRLFTIRLNSYDPLVTLGKVPASRRPSWVVPFFEGPFAPSDL
ncbi:MAG: hypothetical protein KGK11_00405 [Sphingomonadales bacterium]|nr:hypothetical protein [Sphingomonadales bacterium]